VTTFSEFYLLKEYNAVDALQNALDIIGIDPIIGTGADAANVLISTLRSALAKTSDEKQKHIINAGISAISLIPFADIIKLLKLRKSPKLAKPAIAGARALKTAASSVKTTDRFNS
jgi:hypothetical protein